MDHDAKEVEVPKGGSPELDRSGRGEDEEARRDDEWPCEVDDAVRYPGHDVQERVRVPREDVGDVGAVEDRLESREDRDPDVRSVAFGDELGRVEEEEPGEDGRRGEEELGGEGDEEGEGVGGDEEELEEEGLGHHEEGEGGELRVKVAS